MTYENIKTSAAEFHLMPMGGFDEERGTTVLLGPSEPGFWEYVSQHEEFKGENPMDRWSTWAITKLAKNLEAIAVFPFGGPPFHPFIKWSLDSGEAWLSPVGLLVHKTAGLMASYRGALQFERHIQLPTRASSPCEKCVAKPCLDACPVSALSATSGYDVPLCKSHIDQDPVCQAGCRVRRACPISQSYGRDPVQTAFHMRAFYAE